MNLAQILEQGQHDGDGPSRTLLRYGTAQGGIAEISVGQFVWEVRCWAEELQARGIQPGDRVALITAKCPEQIVAFYAVWWVGAVIVPISEALAELELGFVIRDAEPSLVITHDDLQQAVRDAVADEPVVRLSDFRYGHPGRASIQEVAAKLEDDTLAALVYTSGATGMPKGVMLTQGNFRINALSALESIPVSSDDIVMSVLPYWHCFALVVEVIGAVTHGFQVGIPRDKRDFSRNMRRYAPTVLLLVPRIADALMKGIKSRVEEAGPRSKAVFDRAMENASRVFTSSPEIVGGMLRVLCHKTFYDPMVFRRIRARFGGRLRFLICGGAPLDMEHEIFFKYLGVPCYQGYGLTETSPVVSVNLPQRHRLGSCGPLLSWLKPANGGDYTFKDEDGQCGKDLDGELLVRGPCVMKGYWRHRDSSAKVLADGWLHTGDMGTVDADGFLHLHGRSGNMIALFGGEKLHPEHIEEKIRNARLVTEAMVIGDGCKTIYACVNVDPDATAPDDPDDLRRELRDQIRAETRDLARLQQPRDVLVLPEFSVADGTLTVTMKIRRHRIWELYGDTIRGFLRRNGETGRPAGRTHRRDDVFFNKR